MKAKVLLIILLATAVNSFAQNKCNTKFEQLIAFNKKPVITNNDFLASLTIVKNLEANNCSDYVVKRKGVETVETDRTFLFGQICLKNNSRNAVKEYVNYMIRHGGSAEEEISCSFERLFVNQPEDVLSIIGFNDGYLDQLAWGFLNNHYNLHLNPKNYREIFYRVNPKVKSLNPKYKKHIDYLLKSIKGELS